MARRIYVNGEDVTTTKQVSIKNRTIASVEIIDDAFLYTKTVEGDVVSQYFVKDSKQGVGGRIDVQLKDIPLGKHILIVRYAVSDDRQEQSYAINVTVTSRDVCFVKINGKDSTTDVVTGEAIEKLYTITRQNIKGALKSEVSGNFATVEVDNDTLSVTLQKNTTAKERNCTVKVYGLNTNGDTSYAYLYLVQSAGTAYTSVFELSRYESSVVGNNMLAVLLAV